MLDAVESFHHESWPHVVYRSEMGRKKGPKENISGIGNSEEIRGF